MAWTKLGSTKVASELGTAANGTNTGVTLDTSDKKLGAASYDYAGSTSSYTTLGTAAQWNFMSNATANKWSLTFWLKYEDTISGGGHTVLSTTDGSTQNDGFFIDNASGALRLIQVDGDDGTWSGVITDANWHHYAFTWNSGTVTLYVDGVSKGTQSQTAGSGTPQYPIKLAINNDEYPIDCKFDDLGIWKRVLTATEISKLAHNNQGGWVEVAGSSSTKNFTLDTGNSELDCKFYGTSSNGNGSVAYVDLGSGEVSNTTWTLQYTINYSTQSGNQGVGLVGLFDETTASDNAQDGIYTVFMNNDNFVNGNGINGATPNDSWGTNIGATLSNGTDYYVTLKRTAAGTATIDIKTGSHSGSSISNYPANCSNISSSITGLRYIKVLDRKGYSGTAGDVATIKDMKVWVDSNDTSTTPTRTFDFSASGAGAAQLVSSLADTDGLKAHYSMDSTSLGATATKETLDSTNGVTGWTSSANDFTVDSSNNEIDITGATNSETIAYDLGSDVSTSAWLIRFKTTWAGSQTSNPITWFSVSDTNTGGGSSNHDGVNLMYYAGGQWKASSNDGSRPDQATAQNNLSPSTNADTTNYWCEISRNGSNYTCSIYPNDSYATATATLTQSIGSIAGLRYFRGITYGQGSNRTGTLSDVIFYNGISSLTGCKNDAVKVYPNIQSNSSFEETDTGKHYLWDGTDTWTEIG